MPEAAMNKNHSSIFWKHDVRLSGKTFPMQSESISEGVEQRPDPNFRLRVAAFDRRHVATSLLGRMHIHDRPESSQ
jgi:hypothetical protein